MSVARPEVVIIGAGPAGLTAAYELSKSGISSAILEKESVSGGLARTAEYKEYLFDIGGHRFFTKVPMVEAMWREVLGSNLLTRPRLSRIYYNSKFFNYPLKPFNALFGLGPIETLRCMSSYVKARIFPVKPARSFEDWVTNCFGRRLFEIFFRTYTEKVWGIPCNEIRAEWAAQRIRGLSMATLLRSFFRPQQITTLIDEFLYPRRGPGMMWSETQKLVEARGSEVVFEAPVEQIQWTSGKVTAVVAGGRAYRADHFISSMPIRELIERLDPAPPEHVIEAARGFHYRDFLTVALIVRGRDLFPDNWIYVHDPSVKVGRIQNYKNWSPEMVPDPDTTGLGLEYFCFEGDGLWSAPDDALIRQGIAEMARLKLLDPAMVIDGTVVRAAKAYPVYDETYGHALSVTREFLATLPNLQLVGRNGMHHYNNQDHSMLTAMLAARNVLGAGYDLWRINADAEYLEEGRDFTDEDLRSLLSTQPEVPRTVAAR